MNPENNGVLISLRHASLSGSSRRSPPSSRAFQTFPFRPAIPGSFSSRLVPTPGRSQPAPHRQAAPAARSPSCRSAVQLAPPPQVLGTGAFQRPPTGVLRGSFSHAPSWPLEPRPPRVPLLLPSRPQQPQPSWAPAPPPHSLGDPPSSAPQGAPSPAPQRPPAPLLAGLGFKAAESPAGLLDTSSATPSSFPSPGLSSRPGSLPGRCPPASLAAYLPSNQTTTMSSEHLGQVRHSNR